MKTAERDCVTNEELCSLVVGAESNDNHKEDIAATRQKRHAKEEILSVHGLSKRGLFEKISFSLNYTP